MRHRKTEIENAFVRRIDFWVSISGDLLTIQTFRDLDPLTPIKNQNNAIQYDIRA